MGEYTARLWTVAAMTAIGTMLVPGAATAEPLPDSCLRPDTAGPITCTYTTAGMHTLTLPDGVASVQVTAIGGRGGATEVVFGDSQGGLGARVIGAVPVPAQSRTLYAVVGGNGGDTRRGDDPSPGAAGFNGGGPGGAPFPLGRNDEFTAGGGGGGSSDVRTDPVDPRTRLMVAAGGGGASSDDQGGDAGSPGGGFDVGGGQAGTSTTGGIGGTGGPTGVDGAPGGLGIGGAGASARSGTFSTVSGGGGGGGLYGGGGGGLSYGSSTFFGSGGGGSSLQPTGGTTTLSSQAPSVTITYQPPQTPTEPVCTGSACLPTGLFGSS